MSIAFGEWVFDSARRELLRDGVPVRLTSKAFQLLELLLESGPRVVTKAQIYERLWPSTFVAEVNLSRLVFELRKALGDDARKPRWVRTVRGFGYAFASTSDTAKRPRDGRDSGWCRLILKDREVLLAEGENVLGRTHEATVWLSDTSVSRRHARITVEGRRATLEDLGSKNGTSYRDRRITAQVSLHDGDEIRIGTVPITFRIVPPEESTLSRPVR